MINDYNFIQESYKLYLRVDKFLEPMKKVILHENSLYAGELTIALLKDADPTMRELIFKDLEIIDLNRYKELHKSLFKNNKIDRCD
jgi:hypothetical protein